MDNQDQAPAGEPAPLLATKLYLPRPRAQLVARPRLLARLDAGRQGRVTLLAAPAGFGKTTLLADWLSQPVATSRHVAWLALDAGDSDPIQFLRYLIAALQTITPAIGASLMALLRMAQTPPLERLMPVLANDLVALPDASILVLDDYHAVDAPAVHQALAFLLDHLPPQLHVVLASRVDPPLPLSRWRVRGQLTELRANDLRFTTEEAAAFLREAMGVPLMAADVAALEARTEGWVAGLQLAALSLQDRPDAQWSSFIDSFTGDHRFVMDYLVDEALAGQPAHVQAFLLQTSFLDRLCGSLCDAVLEVDSGAQNTDSQMLLERLERANLFIVPLDDARRWYRYHHLFAQMLQGRLVSSRGHEAVATLHGRAATWLEQQGFVVEAVRHTLAAKDWERAARLIEAHGRLLIVRGQAHTLRGWLKILPERLLQTRPILLDLQAVAFFCANQLDAAERSMAAAEAAAADSRDGQFHPIQGYAAILRANIARSRGDLARYVALSRRALETLPLTDLLLRSTAGLGMASAFLINGDVRPANEHEVVAAVATARRSGNLLTLFNSLMTLAEFQRRQGRLRAAHASYREAGEVAPHPVGLQALPNGAHYYFGLGDLQREMNDLDAAEQHLRQGQAMIRDGLQAHGDVITHGYMSLALLQQVRGAGPEARATLRELEALARERGYAVARLADGMIAAAPMALLRDDLPAAIRRADTIKGVPDGEPAYSHEEEYLMLARAYIARGGQGSPVSVVADVVRLLDRLLAAAETCARRDSVIKILILRALALHVQDEPGKALDDLAQALRFAAPEGYVRVVVDEGAPMVALLAKGLGAPGWGVENGSADHGVRAYAEQLLQLCSPMLPPVDTAADSPIPCPNPQDLSATPLPEPLTERELEVLRLLVAGRSNQAIAQELIVTVGTVKRHVSNLMGKLAAESRLEAVAHARELGLV